MENNKLQLDKLSKEELIEIIKEYEEEKESGVIEECRDIIRLSML